MDGSLSVLLLVYVCISFCTITRKSIPVYVVAYEKRYMYNFDIEKNQVLRFIDALQKNSPRILIKLMEKLVQYALFNI